MVDASSSKIKMLSLIPSSYDNICVSTSHLAAKGESKLDKRVSSSSPSFLNASSSSTTMNMFSYFNDISYSYCALEMEELK